ncbi:conserved Plasmodium protein, unknown function [Plasmodium chabaudi chabaudi]|uniref:LIMP protein n=2 Tax=Plasmodium chabaudi TaxID=5825 RepID=A0A1C6Y7X8_PLACE|nr:conserved Plasmodium protein, unknown function [Plasmodium chabaudi adami]SCN58924.1 conserved Plasmodium protein, unknown function [Plasmodium chabaudi adami]SCN58925.1 conserved Plasmodium protein, unknown function [Plasmodium chabaudi chabaudi]
MVIKLIFLFVFFLMCLNLKHALTKVENENRHSTFLQIDRDMNEPPYPVINVHYTESPLSGDLVKQIENNRHIEKYETQNYFRKGLASNKYFMDYSQNQKSQLELLINLNG